MEADNIATRLREAMIAADMKQSELGRQIGVRPSSVSFWLSGRNTPDTENLTKLATLLGVRLEWLGTGRGPMYGAELFNDSCKIDDDLPADAKQLLDQYLRLTPRRKEALLKFIDILKTL